MAVDWVDEGDVVYRHAGTPSEAGADSLSCASPGADQERQAIARRLHRILVDHTYGVAREAWAEAVPQLRAAWENHKTRHPERPRLTPRTTPDGSWVAGDHWRLPRNRTPKPPRPARTKQTRAGATSSPPSSASSPPNPTVTSQASSTC